MQKEIIHVLIFELFIGLGSTNKFYYNICNNNKLWLKLLERDYPFYTPTLESAFIEYAHFHLFFHKQLQKLKLYFHVIHDIDLIKKLYIDFVILDKRYSNADVHCTGCPEMNIIYDEIIKLVDEPKLLSLPINGIRLSKKEELIDIIITLIDNMLNTYSVPEEVPYLIQC